MHDLAITLILDHLETNLSLRDIRLSKWRFMERAYIRWAFFEILNTLYEYSELIYIPEHISGTPKKGVFEIFDEFIYKMENFLSLGYNWRFDVAKSAAVQFKLYLKNTGFFKEEVF